MKHIFSRLTLVIPALLIVGGLSVAAARPVAAKNFDPFTNAPYSEGSCSLPKGKFFGFPTWYQYLKGEQVTPNGNASGLGSCRPYIGKASDLWLIAAAAFEMLLYAAGVVAVGYVIWGAILYVTSQGQPDKIANGKNTIVNAISGLILVILSARIVGFIAGKFSGTASGDFLLPNVAANGGALSTALSIVFQIVGGLSVLFIIWGGITYSRSNGDPGAMKQAKETIIYALVGLAIALFAVGIIDYAVNKLA